MTRFHIDPEKEGKKMDGEQKLWSFAILVIGVIFTSLVVLGTKSCDASSQENTKVLEKCLDAGKPPLECSQLRR